MPENYVASDSTTPFSIGRMIICTTLFMAVLLGMNWAVDKAMPYRFPKQLQNKFDFFLAHSDNYNAIIIGSSFVWNQVFPKDFDGVVNGDGGEFKTYNFGMHGVRFHEQELYTKKILEVLPENIDWVMVDMGTFETTYPEGQWTTDRFHWWHTPVNTLHALQRLSASSRPSEFKRRYGRAHLKSLGLRSFHVGEWQSLKQEYAHSYGGDSRPPKKLGNDGARIDTGRHRVKRAFDDFLDAHSEGIPALTENDLNEADRTALKRYVQLFEDKNVSATFVVPPTVLYSRDVRQAGKEGIFPKLFVFNNPMEYPELYRKEERSDEHHIAYEFTHKFGKAFGYEFAQYRKKVIDQ